MVIFMKNFWGKIFNKKVLVSAGYVFMLALPLILMELYIKVLASSINYFRAEMVFPNILFNVTWILLIVSVSMNLKRVFGQIIYGVSFALFFVLFLTNSIYYSYTGFFFSFNMMKLADEGSAYIWDTIANASPVIYIAAIVILALAVVAIIKFPKIEKCSFKNVLVAIAVFVLAHTITPHFLGVAYDTLQWDTWRNPRNVYENFNDSNKNMKICGLYEYSFRDFYVTFLREDQKDSEEEMQFLEDAYSKLTKHNKNKYTGIFKGKNVIFLQLEGMDSWLLNKKDTPNLHGLLKNAIEFKKHYSFYNGGGSTFNSELAVNTGLIAPISYNENAYSFSGNLYTESLPKIFKEMGYSTNAFHMNTGEYYSRELNYKNWGYDNYYGLLDEKAYTDVAYELDRELILNETFYDKMFNQEGPFMHYIITYTPHTPFNALEGKGLLLAQEKYGENIPELTEEECARMYATETDYMVGLLLKALEEHGQLENTVIVAFADHYLYTLNDKSILDEYKHTKNNLINQTPFFVWSSDQKAVKINKVNSQIDILPTVLNMFGHRYKEEYYIGNDVMDKGYSGYVFFSDYSWYDGKFYVENGEVVKSKKKKKVDANYLADMNAMINQIIQKNDLTLKYDYFRTLLKNSVE